MFLPHVSPDTCTLSGCEEQTEARATVTGLRPVGCEMNPRANTLFSCYTHFQTLQGCICGLVRERIELRKDTYKNKGKMSDKKLSHTVFLAILQVL